MIYIMYTHRLTNHTHHTYSALEEESFLPGSTIFKQGEDGDTMYIINKGFVEVGVIFVIYRSM